MSLGLTTLVFPGQGAHDFAMLEGVRDAVHFADRYRLVCDQLETDVIQELKDGNRAYLNQNKVSSVLTVFVSSLSLDLYLEREEVPSHYAGYSVGQWTALYAAGCITFEQLIEIVSTRAELMDHCFQDVQGAMMAVLGVRRAELQDFIQSIRKQGYFIEISNFNCLGQYSVAGTKEAIEAAFETIEDLKPKKAMLLPVQGAWHCSLLKPAESAFAEYINAVHFLPNEIPVWDNTTGERLPVETDLFKQHLVRHISQPVLWEQEIKNLIDHGCEEFVETGFGNVLTKFGFFIDRDRNHRSFYAG